MELARHSDMRLTMKTYTDAAQLPLAATVRGLPSFDDSHIDSQTLVADRPAVSPSVIGLKPIKVGKTVGNIDESRNLTPVVALCHSGRPSGNLGFESPLSATLISLSFMSFREPVATSSGNTSTRISPCFRRLSVFKIEIYRIHK